MSLHDQLMNALGQASQKIDAETVTIDGQAVSGVVGPVETTRVLVEGGQRLEVEFTVHVLAEVNWVEKGMRVETTGTNAAEGRVVRVTALGGAGYEILVGPANRRTGRVPF
jgi:hypothetical protein